MESIAGENTRIYHSKVDGSGRIVLPADVRLRQHIHTGDHVVIIENDHGLQVRTHDQAVREARAVFSGLAPADVVLSDELIRDRRQEAERE